MSRWAAGLLLVPLVVTVVVSLYAYGRDAGAAWLLLFAVGPIVVLAGRRWDIRGFTTFGVAFYVLYILVWSFSWGTPHVLIGLPAMILGILVDKNDRSRARTESAPVRA